MRLLVNGPLRLCGALTVLLAWLFCFSCSGPQADFKLETASPNGQYKVKLEGRGEPPNARFGEFQRQVVTLETTRDAQVVAADGRFFSDDSWDVYFLQRYPVREWVNNSTLRFGDLTHKGQFQDRLIVTNRTGKQFDLVIVHYGKYEMFFVYDLAAGKQVELNASPQLDKEYPASSVYYQAFAKLVRVTGNVNGPGRTKDSANPTTLAVDIVE